MMMQLSSFIHPSIINSRLEQFGQFQVPNEFILVRSSAFTLVLERKRQIRAQSKEFHSAVAALII